VSEATESHVEVSPKRLRRAAAGNIPLAVDTVINVKVILIGLTSEVKRPPLA